MLCDIRKADSTVGLAESVSSVSDIADVHYAIWPWMWLLYKVSPSILTKSDRRCRLENYFQQCDYLFQTTSI